MKPLTSSLLVATAAAFAGLREEGGNNRGLMIERMLRKVGLVPGQPWCAAFVHHVGFWSHYDYAALRSDWPLPATGSCWILGQFAKRNRILHTEPEVGDVFLLWDDTLGRFAHTGIIAHVRDIEAEDSFWCDTIEGNSNDEGGAAGQGVFIRTRHFGVRDRFIRWVALDKSSRALSTQAGSTIARKAA